MEGLVEKMVEGQVLRTLETVEAELDAKLEELEKMDDEDLESLRERRKEEMKRAARQRAEWRAKGHGRYAELTTEKEFFEAAKGSKRMVCHFYRPTTWRCEIIDKHVGELAPAHEETRFVKINAEKSPFLCEKLHIWMLPTLVLVKEGKTEHSIVGFDELGGSDDFPTEHLEAVLTAHGMLHEK